MQNNKITENFKGIQQRINAAQNNQEHDTILLISVSKTQPVEVLEAAFKTGITVFGENYAQKLREKAEYFLKTFKDQPQPEWHFIGHLQTNKVKYVVPHATMIHSVDSLKVAQEISKQALKANKTIQILIQINTSGELSKSGCEPGDVLKLAEEVLKLPNIFPAGLMTIPANDDDISAHREFAMLRRIRNELQEKFGEKYFHHLSMGMTHDFEIAIAEGATIVRIGTAIFGERNATL